MRTFIDIGSVEHVFDSRQCFENCLRMVALGGHYMLHTPVNGYYAHGYHTFHPGCLRDMLDLNGFTRIFESYCTMQGEPVVDPSHHRDVIGWHVARKEREMGRFVCPQQGNWAPQYARKVNGPLSGSTTQRSFKACGGRTRTRTLDPLIKSQLLYQLSYAPGADKASAQAGRAVAKRRSSV